MLHRRIDWHSACISTLRIEWKEYQDILEYSTEYELNKGSRRADCLIIKADGSPPIRSPVAGIFQKYNVVEYKGPDDYLSVSDFFKAVSYVYSFPSLLKDNSAIEKSTLTIIMYRYPRNLIKKFRKFGIKHLENRISGIYTIDTNVFLIPIQLVIIPQLRSEDCLWLHSLTKNLDFDHSLERIKREYQLNKDDPDYHTFMDTLIRANTRQEGDTAMWCDAMYEIFEDDLKAREERGMQIGKQQGVQQGMQQGIRQGIDQMASLTLHLISDNCGADVIKRAATDREFREELMKRYQLM